MKKKKLKNLSLNKTVISNLNLENIKGGKMPESDPGTYTCDGDANNPLPIATCGCVLSNAGEVCIPDSNDARCNPPTRLC